LSKTGPSAKPHPASGQDLFDQAPEPLLVVRLDDWRVTESNEAATDKFGYTREQFRSMKLADFHSGADVERLRNAAALRDTTSSELRGWTTRNSRGEGIDTDLSVRFIEYKGVPSALICILDMTARKSLEERLRQAGKMEAIGMLAGGIAHDFNNLLTIISGYSQLLLHAVPEKERSSLEQVLKASERAAELTGQLLAFSRRQELQPQSLDVNRIVSGMSTMLRRLIGEHIELRLSLAPDLGAVHADPSQIDQVIMNLVVNARDAMAQGGKLVIETSNFEVSDDFAGKHLGMRPGGYILLAVSDTGIGMDQQTRLRAFDPFFTTKEKGQGTGFGLSTVYGIVKQAGGAVDIYSELKHGTSVKVYLPRAGEVSAIENTSASQMPEAAGGRETILVVEDEDAVRRLVRATLERRGYRVLVASGGPEALEIVRKLGTVDLLLTDLVMPQMSGVEVAERVRKDFPNVRVLYMSGYTDRSLQRTEMLPDEGGFLQKPFTPGLLATRVREALDEDDAESSSHAAGFQ
jgi:two-component system cell cycle sensor histidine kinase/response regulator CckA